LHARASSAGAKRRKAHECGKGLNKLTSKRQEGNVLDTSIDEWMAQRNKISHASTPFAIGRDLFIAFSSFSWNISEDDNWSLKCLPTGLCRLPFAVSGLTWIFFAFLQLSVCSLHTEYGFFLAFSKANERSQHVLTKWYFSYKQANISTHEYLLKMLSISKCDSIK
jgi:hypothetical protein